MYMPKLKYFLIVCVGGGRLKGLQSNDKAMIKATFLGVNFQFKPTEGSSNLKHLLTCRYPLTVKP